MSQKEAFNFCITSWPQRRAEIRREGSAVYFEAGEDAPPDTKRTFNPTDEDWSQFWEAVDKLKVWDWHNRISGPDTEFRYGGYHIPQIDGETWSLLLERGGRKFECGRSNAYPGVKGTSPGQTFRRFLTAVNELTGEELFANAWPSNKTN
jgi:hypothetical protein